MSLMMVPIGSVADLSSVVTNVAKTRLYRTTNGKITFPLIP